jgi:hypothetical protein
MVGPVVKTGAVDQLARAATEFTGGNGLLTAMLILGVSAPVSGVIDDIPFTATMTPIVGELSASISDLTHPDVLWWALAPTIPSLSGSSSAKVCSSLWCRIALSALYLWLRCFVFAQGTTSDVGFSADIADRRSTMQRGSTGALRG